MGLKTILKFALAFAWTNVWLVGLCPAGPVEDIVKTWQDRQQQFETVRFRISGVLSEPAGYLMLHQNADPRLQILPFPREDRVEKIRGELLLDLTNRRLLRRRISGRAMGTLDSEDLVFFPGDEVVTFNGDVYKFHTPHDLNLANSPMPNAREIELSIQKDNLTKMVFHVEHYPLLFTCGIVHASTVFDPHDLHPKIDASLFKNDGEVTLNGQLCMVLRTVPDLANRYLEIWVDSKDSRKIRQMYAYTTGAKLWLALKISYQETEHGPIPESWTIDHIWHATGKVATYAIKLDEFEANPTVADADFEINPPPGTFVDDRRRPKDSRQYVIADPGKPNLPLKERFLQNKQNRLRFWMTAGTLVLILLGTVVFLYCRRVSP